MARDELLPQDIMGCQRRAIWVSWVCGPYSFSWRWGRGGGGAGGGEGGMRRDNPLQRLAVSEEDSKCARGH